MVIEIALFRTKAGVSDERVLEVSDALQREVVAFDGYLGRQLCKSEDGQWADVVRWASEEAALEVAKAFETMACAQAFMEMEEPGSSRILLLRPVKEFPGSARAASELQAAAAGR